MFTLQNDSNALNNSGNAPARQHDKQTQAFKDCCKAYGLTLPVNHTLVTTGAFFSTFKPKKGAIDDKKLGYCYNAFSNTGEIRVFDKVITYPVNNSKTTPKPAPAPASLEPEITTPEPIPAKLNDEVQADVGEFGYAHTGIDKPIDQELSEEKKTSINAVDSSTVDPTSLNDCPYSPEPDYSTMPTDDNDCPPLTSYEPEPANNPVIDLKNPKEAESFALSIIEKLANCTNELEAINAVVDAVISSKAKNFDKTIAGYLSSQITDNVKGLKGKKTAINKGVIDAVKIAKAKQITALSKPSGKVQALNKPLPADSFPNIVPLENGSISILSTVDNLKHLLKGYGMEAVYDEVAKSQELLMPKGSTKGSTLSHDLHNEADIQRLCSQAALNGINENIVGKLPIITTENTINPVKDFIHSKKWDGVSRINEFCSSLIVLPEDRELTNKIVRTWLIQCIAALDRAKIGCDKNPLAVAKYELVLTLQGIQGATKTTWFSSLLPRSWKGEKFGSRYIGTGATLQLENKDSIKQVISYWIVELGELEGTFKKSAIAELKAFLSKVVDRLRMPYAKAECDYLRSTSFCGSVNDERFLNDPTGARRFGVVKVSAVEVNKTDMQQLWAEIWQLYAGGEQWWLDKETEAAMQLRGEQHQTISPIEDAILSRFDWSSDSKYWCKRMTLTEVYQACFDKKPNKADLNAIKPFTDKLGVKVTKPQNVITLLMPDFKQQ